MTMPEAFAEIAFIKDATDGSPLWRDVSDDVEWWKGVRISRRRSHELDEVQPGTLSLALTNEDGRYTAGNTASPYYPNVRINRPIRIRARWPLSANRLLYHQARGMLTNPVTGSVLWSAEQGTLAEDLAVFPPGQTSSVRWATGTLSSTGRQLRIGAAAATTATSWGLHVDAGSAYTFSCQIRRNASLALSVSARLRWYDAAGAFLSESAGTARALTTAFQSLTVTATAPAAAVWARVVVANTTTTTGTVSVYVSAAQFEQAASAAAWTSPGLEYIRYTGFVDKWPHAWDNGVLGVVSLTATDRMKLLGRQSLGAVPLTDNQLSGARAEALLAAAGATPAIIDTGVSLLGLTGNEATQKILQLLRQVATSEAGLFFIGRDGIAVFHDRGRRQRPSSVVLTVEADQCGDGLNFLVDDALLINDATVVDAAGGVASATDSASIDEYGQYSGRLETNLIPAEIADRAQYLLFRYKEPAPRASQITIEARSQPALWPALLDSEIGQRIQVTNLPANAPTGTLDLWIEGVQDVITDETWSFTIDPSPASTTVAFILDDPLYGLLDHNVLGW
ncbi:hypothetical protein [Nonomuraea ceibae]|uniref:hypothetical protein n=1 Tax=Nonomuraea ceibae TaxID=1935170 RepID=UPI001C5F0E53|nr:hypothetical protein [Nonomuraea ceibae]